MKTVDNEAGVFNAKVGYYKGKKVTVTHRDPKSGQLWLEDFPTGKSPVEYGLWANADNERYR